MSWEHLELFAGGGGSAYGMVQAGADHVVAVDTHIRADLPPTDKITWVKASALDVLCDVPTLRSFTTMGGSPPCQTETALVELRKAQGKSTDKVNLIPETLAGFEAAGRPYYIENVPRSSVRPDVVLCGRVFGLRVRRHRWFQLGHSPMILSPGCACSAATPIGVYGSKGDLIPAGGTTAASLEEGRAAMGNEWMSWSALVESIPWRYTQWIGQQWQAAGIC